jgi:ketosteroid isomerase-like protein
LGGGSASVGGFSDIAEVTQSAGLEAQGHLAASNISQQFKLKIIHYSFHDVKPHVSGDMAYATLKYHIAVKMESREVEGEGLATAILMKTANGWKIQHMHTSRIPPKKPEEKK